MNYHDTLEHLTHIIAEQEGCSRTIAHKRIADALQMPVVTNFLAYTVALQTDPKTQLRAHE